MNEAIFEAWSRKSFLKVKNTCFGIGKVLFSFVNIDGNKRETEHIDCYLDMDEAGAFAREISLGFIGRRAEASRKEGGQYPKAVWDSGLGGVSEQKAAQQKLRTDGKALSRIFSLAPGSKSPYIMTAIARPGHTDERGLIVPENGAAPEITVRVPIDDKALRTMAFAIESSIMAFRSCEYNAWFREEIEKAQEKDRQQRENRSRQRQEQYQSRQQYQNGQGQNMQNRQQYQNGQGQNGQGRQQYQNIQGQNGQSRQQYQNSQPQAAQPQPSVQQQAQARQQAVNAQPIQEKPAEAQAPSAVNTGKVTQFPGTTARVQKRYNAKSVSELRQSKAGWIIKCVLDGNETIYLLFTHDSVSAMSKARWDEFCTRTSAGTLKFHFVGEEVPRTDGKKQIVYASGL